jgi:hypothetical protein
MSQPRLKQKRATSKDQCDWPRMEERKTCSRRRGVGGVRAWCISGLGSMPFGAMVWGGERPLIFVEDRPAGANGAVRAVARFAHRHPRLWDRGMDSQDREDRMPEPLRTAGGTTGRRVKGTCTRCSGRRHTKIRQEGRNKGKKRRRRGEDGEGQKNVAVMRNELTLAPLSGPRYPHARRAMRASGKFQKRALATPCKRVKAPEEPRSSSDHAPNK